VPVADLVLLDLRETPDAAPEPHPRSCSRSIQPSAGACARRRTGASGFHYVNAAARRLYTGSQLRGLVSRLFDRRARPIANISFAVGSQQCCTRTASSTSSHTTG
jgi:hypothetical protein